MQQDCENRMNGRAEQLRAAKFEQVADAAYLATGILGVGPNSAA